MNFAGFLIPGYFSMEALFSESKTDDTQVRLPWPTKRATPAWVLTFSLF